MLRGALGTTLRRLACLPECPGASACGRRAECPYARMFEPRAMEPGPSSLAHWPRPFVFRSSHLDGRRVGAGERFHFDMNLFEWNASAIELLAASFRRLRRDGLGPGRRRVDLSSVERLNERDEPDALLCPGDGMRAPQALVVDLSPIGERISCVRVRFVTPTELKRGDGIAARPEFAVLAARVRDRISSLRELYGPGPLEMDFRAFGERAALVKMTRCDTAAVDSRRRSSRTGQVHPIGGFVGEAEYEGELGEFLPFLRAAKWTGVGRQTAWGKGEIAVESLG